jgi:hypothetical protein
MVRFEGPTQVDPGAEVTYRFVVHSEAPAVQIQAGLDVAASDGKLVVVAGQNTKLLQGEITHTGPKDIDQNAEASWQFIWQAPTTPGEYMLFGAGNSVDASGTVDDDDGNLTVLVVTVGTVVATATATAPLLNTPTVTPPPIKLQRRLQRRRARHRERADRRGEHRARAGADHGVPGL